MLSSVNKNSEYSFAALENETNTTEKNKTASTLVGDDSVRQKALKLLGSDKSNSGKNISSKNSINTVNSENENDNNLKIKNFLKEDEDKDKGLVDIFEDEEGSGNSSGIIYGSDFSALTRSFDALAASVGSSDDKITKSQLIALLQSLSAKGQSSDKFKEEISFVKNLIAKFDTISNGEGYITSFSGVNDPQDYKTVTPEQVTSPVSLLI